MAGDRPRNRWQRKAAGAEEVAWAPVDAGDDDGFWDAPAAAAPKATQQVVVAREAHTREAPRADAAAAAESDALAREAAEAEVAALEAIYGEEFEVLSPSEWRVDLAAPPGAPSAALRLLLPPGYPMSPDPPVPVIDCDYGGDDLGEAVSALAQELQEEWKPSAEGCAYQWAERFREAVRRPLDDAASRSLAAAAQAEEVEAATAAAIAEAVEADVQETRGFTVLPANPQYGQRQRHFDGASFDDGFAVEIHHGEPVVDRKSTFVAHAAKVASKGQVQWALREMLSDRKVSVATHNIFAYRFFDDSRGVQVADNDDDGEDGAGSKLAQLLSLSGCEGVLVMVSRWYGGIHLGPDRFKHINRAASTLLDGLGWTGRGRGPSGAKGPQSGSKSAGARR